MFLFVPIDDVSSSQVRKHCLYSFPFDFSLQPNYMLLICMKKKKHLRTAAGECQDKSCVGLSLSHIQCLIKLLNMSRRCWKRP